MKKNTNASASQEPKNKNGETVIYTILDRYLLLCKQAKLIPKGLSLNERYMKYGLF